jgi:hypothetical protein
MLLLADHMGETLVSPLTALLGGGGLYLVLAAGRVRLRALRRFLRRRT